MSSLCRRSLHHQEMQILLRGCWLQLNPRRLCQSLLRRCYRNSVAVDLGTFDVGAAARQQKVSVVELHYVQHNTKSCALIVVTDHGFDDNRRSRGVGRVLTSVWNEMCPATSLIGPRGSRFIGGMHHGISRCIAGQGNSTSIHFILQLRQLPSVV